LKLKENEIQKMEAVAMSVKTSATAWRITLAFNP
jgi:hypothetical protein